ncbi:MAG: hypothetical protein J0L85_07810 [Zoogloea sp.]|nr:hypothetical protein [Zoogloea sp.]MCA0188660.1 hypothetical protein [Pseudomonadota bacterium]
MKHLLGGLIAVSALGIAGAAGLPVLKPEPRRAEDTPPPPRPEHPPGPDLLQVEAAHIVADRIELAPDTTLARP